MLKRAKRFYLMFAVVAFVFVGCGDDSSTNTCSSNADCSSGQYCGNNGTCTFDCRRDDDCSGGKCSSIGKCVASTQPDAGVPLDQGQTQPTCGANNCSSGCCTGTTCMPGTSTSACGSSGASCQTCSTGYVCANKSCRACQNNNECDSTSVCAHGVCGLAFNRQYRVTIVSAQLNQYNYTNVASGEAWDVLGGMPDPFVGITIGSNPLMVSSTKQDTLTPTWNDYLEANIKSGELFRIDVFDADLTSDDWIGGFEWQTGLPIAILKSGGVTAVPNPADPKYGLQELVFTIEPL